MTEKKTSFFQSSESRSKYRTAFALVKEANERKEGKKERRKEGDGSEGRKSRLLCPSRGPIKEASCGFVRRAGRLRERASERLSFLPCFKERAGKDVLRKQNAIRKAEKKSTYANGEIALAMEPVRSG